MDDTDSERLPTSRRSVVKGAGGLGASGVLTGVGSADGFGGDGGDGDGGGGGGSSGGDDRPTGRVTLITGHTVRVTEGEDRRRYTVEDEMDGYRTYELEEQTYLVPDGVDLSRFSEALFNVDLLLEQGLSDEETDVVPVIVSLSTSVEDGPDASAMEGGGYEHRYSFSSIDAMAGGVRKDRDGASATGGGSGDVVDMMAESDAVERVHLDARAEALLDEATPAVAVEEARSQFDVDGSGTTVAVLDTGLDRDHPDFDDRIVDRIDFTGDGLGDRDGHGTHCAGIAVGSGTVDEAFTGMAPGADIMDVKVLGDDGFGTFSDIIAGVEYAVDNGADIMNMSLGGPPQADDPLAAAVNQAADDGVLSAVAAGNSFFPSFGGVESPAIAERATSVAATEADEGVAFFSQKGPSPFEQNLKPEIAAPGADIEAPGSEDADEFPYTRKGGTSMAAPMVAGVAALLIEAGTAQTPQDLEDRLVSTADRIAGESVFSAGGGELNALEALASDLRVRDGVVNFGVVEEPASQSATVTLENTGDAAIEVAASAELRNLEFAGDDGEDISDQVSVAPGSLTLEPGATESVELSLEPGDAFGYNSGYLTFETGDGTVQQTVFGYVRGIEVEVEKIPHPDSDGVAGDSLLAYAHDGAYSELGFTAFDASGQYSFVALDGGGKYTLWSGGQLAAGPDSEEGPPAWTIKEVELSPDNSSFVLDEGTVVPRRLDTSQVADLGPFQNRRFDANVYANYEDGPAVSAARGFIGPFGIDTAYYTPVTEAEPTNVGCFYLFHSTPESEAVFDADNLFHFFDGTLELTGPEDVVTVDPDTFAREEFTYHRTVEDQFWSVGPAAFPADTANFPTFFLISFETDIGADRVEQTWYRNAQTAYEESWEDAGPGFFGRYQLKRSKSVFDGELFSPEQGAVYDQPFNRDPLTDALTTFDLSDGSLDLRGQWYTDVSDVPFSVFQFEFGSPNTWSVTVDGTEVASDTSGFWGFPVTTVEDITPGSTVGVSLGGNVLAPTTREARTRSDWSVTYRPGTANTPPQVDDIDVRGLSTLNELPASQAILFVDVLSPTADLASFQAWYAPTGEGTSPFDDAARWQRAPTRYAADGLYGVLVDSTGYTGSLDLAMAAVDADGNSVRKWSEGALTIADGADLAAPMTLQTDTVNTRSNRRIPVTITATESLDVDRIDAGSLRLGAPRTVFEGGGAVAEQTTALGNGSLRAFFRPDGTAFPCGGPVAAQLGGTLEDGTDLSGAAVLPTVVCPDGDEDSNGGGQPGGGGGPP